VEIDGAAIDDTSKVLRQAWTNPDPRHVAAVDESLFFVIDIANTDQDTMGRPKSGA
jgi:hypothetical protein